VWACYSHNINQNIEVVSDNERWRFTNLNIFEDALNPYYHRIL